MSVIDQSRWRLVITDMSGNATAGGGPLLNASGKQFSYHKNAGRTAQVTINIDNPLANYILSTDTLLKLYRKNRSGVWQRWLVGDVIQADESAQGDTGLLTLVASDPWWRFQRRLVGMGVGPTGIGLGYQDGTVVSLVDNSFLLRNLLNTANAAFFTGVQLGTVATCGTTGYLGPVYAQNVGDLMQQLCNTLGGPDFEVVPIEPSGLMPNTTIGTMNIYQALGQNRPNCVFEYGTGQRNVATYDRILSKDGLCNQAYSPPNGFPSATSAGDTMVIGQDTTSQNSIGLYQDQVQGDMASIALRQELANEYIQVRAHARQQITFTPTVDCNLDFGVDYNVGDTVIARAFVNGQYRYNGTARIYGVDLSIDDNDAETPVLTLIPS